MTTFRTVLITAQLYNERFAHVSGRSVDNDILGIFCVAKGGTVRDLLGADYKRFVQICDLYIDDPDDDMVVLTN